jgi:hypothetical protein
MSSVSNIFKFNNNTILTTPYTGNVDITGVIKANDVAATNIYDSSQCKYSIESNNR